MKVGKIEQLTTGQSFELSKALDTLRNPGGGVTLVSHGFVKRCRVCEQHTHAKWHEVAKGEINPIALLELLDRLNDDGTGVIEAIRGWVVIMAGVDVAAMRALVESERAVDAVDPQVTDTGKPSTRD